MPARTTLFSLALPLCCALIPPVHAAPAAVLSPASDAAPAGAPAAEAVPSLDSLAARWASDHIEGRFVEKKRIAGFPKPLVSEGHFAADKSSGARWETEKPFPSVLILDENGMRYEGTASASSIGTTDVPAIGRFGEFLRGMLAGDLAVLSALFELSVTVDDGIPSVRARPHQGTTADSLSISSIVLTGNDHVERIVMTSPSGDVTELTLSEVIRR